MKKLALIISISAAAFAASDCAKVLEKMDAQIVKAQSAKSPNAAKIDYLNGLKTKITAECKDGKIDTNHLNELKNQAKYDFENAKLAAKQEELDAKRALLEEKHKAAQEKIEAKKQKIAEKEAKKAEKAKLKAEKQAAKEAKKAEKAAEKADKAAAKLAK